ncbi:MAG: transporter substrate-binding domain-containing protein [Limnospira sp. PMC 894.15]|uniref:Transporter substrate-binding domain-containing protein n=1 Tax=Limnospira fusiformis PMC 851.14 TaxID=2219512 RepID=A0ABU9ESW9_LIMFS|nr:MULTISPECIES: transporter substrate-binding domain-containing protein [unclassified Limnospira]MDT9189295.1 transporter substrate-binding domain-containing protein [Limnospira sp. PMC 894.15]MDT9235711.1 transporter substrate-binding domain-containing protein [Limnospira sp. PMC 917.15]MDT9276611.1 transporter substrate-binding domain-containing protein [Limnospira sp. PMC 737.11]MDY7055495.1 transporter substrate-binding domain-containing protein [Limnospira fusiformis LS22]
MNHHKMNFVAAFSSCLIIPMYLGVYAAPVQGTGEIVRVGIYENQPKVFIDETGKPAGFWVDLLNPIARKQNWQLQYIPCEWNQCLELLEEGQLDLMVDVAHSEERDRRFNFNQEVVLHAADGSYLYVTTSREILLGYTPEELIAKNPTDILQPDQLYPVSLESSLNILPGISRPIIYRIRQKNGQYIWLETLTKVILDDQGEVRHLQSTSRDISDRIQAEEQLKYDALHDGLTGLPNRNHLMARLDMALKRAKNNPNLQLAILF